MHVLVRVGPDPAGEPRRVQGKIYLKNHPKETIVNRYSSGVENYPGFSVRSESFSAGTGARN